MLHVSYADYQTVYKGTLTESDYGSVADEACAYVKDSKFQSRVKSFNNDGYSETYDSYSTVQRSFKQEIYDAATIYIPLSDPLRYAGVSS